MYWVQLYRLWLLKKIQGPALIGYLVLDARDVTLITLEKYLDATPNIVLKIPISIFAEVDVGNYP